MLVYTYEQKNICTSAKKKKKKKYMNKLKRQQTNTATRFRALREWQECSEITLQ
jgi:hypothetical protein